MSVNLAKGHFSVAMTSMYGRDYKQAEKFAQKAMDLLSTPTAKQENI